MERMVSDEEYITRNHLTVCIITLHNGWYLVGKSAPVDSWNYDEAYGREAAYDDALRQL